MTAVDDDELNDETLDVELLSDDNVVVDECFKGEAMPAPPIMGNADCDAERDVDVELDDSLSDSLR